MTLNKWMNGPQVTYTAWKQQHRRNRAMLCRKKMRVLVCEEFNVNVKCNCCDGVKAGWTQRGCHSRSICSFGRLIAYIALKPGGQKKKESGCPKEGGHLNSLLSPLCGPLHFVTSLLCFRARLFRDQIGKQSAKGGGRGGFPAKPW